MIVCKSKVEIITRSRCGYSNLMRDFLVRNEIPFEEYNVNLVGTDIKKERNVENSTYPAVFLNGDFIGGYTDAMNHKFFLDNRKESTI